VRNRLGQAQNRLLNLRTDIILTRRFLYPAPGKRSYAEYMQFAPAGPAWPKYGLTLAPGIEIQHPDFRTLELIKANPSPDELADLGLADAFYGPMISPVKPLEQFNVEEQRDVFGGMTDAQVRGYYMCRIPPWQPLPPGELLTAETLATMPVNPPSTEPFCCPTEPPLPNPYAADKPNTYLMTGGAYFTPYRFSPKPYSLRTYFWDRAIGTPWSEMKPAIPNYVEIERVLEWYPFPQPFQRDYAFILGPHIIPEIRNFALLPGALNETVIRMFLTTTVLAKFEPMTKALEGYLEEQAENEQRRRIVSAIGIAAVGAIVAAGLAAAAVSSSMSSMATKGLSAVSDFHSKQQQANFADQVEAASNAFKTEDPAFAAEVKFTADVFRFLSEDAGRLSQLSPEEQARIAGEGGGIGLLEIAGVGVGVLALAFLLGAFD